MKNFYLPFLSSLFLTVGSLNAYSADITIIGNKDGEEIPFGHNLHDIPEIISKLNGIVIEFYTEKEMAGQPQLATNITYELDLAEQNLTITDIMALQPHTQTIIGLDLSDNLLDNNFLEHLLIFPHLRKLNLSNNRFDEEGLEFIGKIRHLSHLNLYFNKVTPAGLQKLKGLDLTTLNVSCIFLGNEGVRLIQDLFPSLEFLEMRACQLDEEALPYLLEMPHLEEVDISSNNIDSEALSEFIVKAKEKGLEVITQ
ncbi:MAG: hypothetical protein K0M45_03565 [Candidatus Paracaedibacteraceae bacterium]|nr:hypothetical protein [Candidatus Paracaedibacteraceae bacterium]